MTDEQKQKYKDNLKNYRKNMTDEQKQKYIEAKENKEKRKKKNENI